MPSSYKVELTKSALKEFNKLSVKLQDRMLEAFHILSQNPFSEFLDIKKLKGEDHLYRIRVGSYRLVYEIQKQVLKVIIIKIGDRKEVYRFFM